MQTNIQTKKQSELDGKVVRLVLGDARSMAPERQNLGKLAHVVGYCQRVKLYTVQLLSNGLYDQCDRNCLEFI